MNTINTTDFPSKSRQQLKELYTTALSNFWKVGDLVEEVELTNYNEANIEEAYIDDFIEAGNKFKEASEMLQEHCKRLLNKRGLTEDEILNLIHRVKDE
tara:strand:- start:430 stop:726 length:297 start_codon:yes stop_codon:yes gene_type:complete